MKQVQLKRFFLCYEEQPKGSASANSKRSNAGMQCVHPDAQSWEGNKNNSLPLCDLSEQLKNEVVPAAGTKTHQQLAVIVLQRQFTHPKVKGQRKG